jgi:MFS family permease
MTLKEQFIGKEEYKSNLIKIIIETILTSIGAGFSVATITVFWNSIGMNQVDIGFVQMAFTIVICLLDIPMGYLADRCNRKALNIIGDIGVAFIFVIYSFSQNIYMTLISECLLGLFMAMTNGVDQSFIKYNCDKIDETGNLFKKINVKIHTARYIALLIVTALGGLIAKYSIRLSIGISFIPYFIGGAVAFNIKDYNKKLKAKHKNPVKDMIHSVKKIIKEKNTRIYLISYILGKEITHSQIWIFTPLLIMVGVPIEIVSIGWILNYLTQIIGSKLSEKMIKCKTSKKFAIPVLIEISWMIILIINTNIITIWLFALNGFVHGLIEGNLVTSLQESATDEIQTSIMSVASTGARLLYIPLVYVINYLGNIQLQLALLGVICLFLPMCIISYIQLRKLEGK